MRTSNLSIYLCSINGQSSHCHFIRPCNQREPMRPFLPGHGITRIRHVHNHKTTSEPSCKILEFLKIVRSLLDLSCCCLIIIQLISTLFSNNIFNVEHAKISKYYERNSSLSLFMTSSSISLPFFSFFLFFLET